MERRMPIRAALIALVAVLAAVGGAVSALAVTTQTATTVYYACVNNSTGAVHMTTASAACPGGSRKIHWNQQGPRGPRGPSDAYEATADDIPSSGNDGSFADVVSLAVPAGSYTVTAKLSAYESTAPDDDISCELLGPLRNGTAIIDASYATFNRGTYGYAETTVTMMSTLDTTSSVTLDVQCRDRGVATYHDAKLIATKVDSVTVPAATVNTARRQHGTRP
jgi:hypothetical protein